MESPDAIQGILSNVCFDCWKYILFPSIYDREATFTGIVENPVLQQRYANRSNSLSLDTVCGFCHCKKINGDLAIDCSPYFRDDPSLLSLDLKSVDLDEIFSNKFENYFGNIDIDNESCDESRILKGFNFGVLSVHLLRICSPENRHLLPGFLKTSIRVSLTKGFKSIAEEKWTPFANSYFENRTKILEYLSQDGDDLALQIKTYLSTNVEGFEFHLLNVLKERLKYILSESIVNVSIGFKEKYSNLYNYILNVSNDRLLFEQLIRMGLNAVFTIDCFAKLTDLSLSRDVVTFLGSYNKYAYGISQTIWMLNKKQKSPLSVEECIGVPFARITLGDKYKLMASGREDADVRTIGKGRGFCLEIYNCKRDLFDIFRIMIALERTGQEPTATSTCRFRKFPTISLPGDFLNNPNRDYDGEYGYKCTDGDAKGDYRHFSLGTDTSGFNEEYYFTNDSTTDGAIVKQDLSVRCCNNGDLVTNFYDLDARKRVSFAAEFWELRVSFNSKRIRRQVHEGSHSHTKSYECIVFTHDPLNASNIDSLPVGPLEIMQGNPIRTCHRKGLEVRVRTIYELSASLLHPRLVFIRLKSQAGGSKFSPTNDIGSYIKEFVTGDLGRTRPSLCDLLGSSYCKVLRLDVVDFN